MSNNNECKECGSTTNLCKTWWFYLCQECKADMEGQENICTACYRYCGEDDCEDKCDCICEMFGEPILREDYCKLCLVEIDNGGDFIHPDDCPHCAYPDKKWSKGCCDKCFENRLLDDDTGLCKFCTDDDFNHEIDLDDSLYPQGLDWSFNKPSANVPYKIVYIFEKCTNKNRCEECTHCARTKPCSCGCGLLGGSCNKGYQLDLL